MVSARFVPGGWAAGAAVAVVAAVCCAGAVVVTSARAISAARVPRRDRWQGWDMAALRMTTVVAKGRAGGGRSQLGEFMAVNSVWSACTERGTRQTTLNTSPPESSYKSVRDFPLFILRRGIISSPDLHRQSAQIRDLA